MKRFHIKKGIFSKLVMSYIIFAIMIALSFGVSIFFAAFCATDGQLKGQILYPKVNEEGEITNFDTIQRLGGWVEELDENRQIVKVYGDKQTENKGYTQQEIYQLLNIEADYSQPFIGFLMEHKEGHLLCIYDRSVIQIKPTIMIGESKTTGQLNHTFTIMFVCLFALNCTLFSVYLSRKIKRPLSRIVEGMERVKTGEEHVRLDFKTESEFGQIRDTFNIMVDKIEAQQSEKKVSEQKKNQMMLELSHDIKTPIATIKSCANALEAGVVPEDKKLNYYQTIEAKSDRVGALAEDMFMLLKMENPEYVLHLQQTDICEAMRKICAEFYEEVEAAGFRFAIDIPEDSCQISLDPQLFVRVIGNLITNAVKYNQSGTWIGVSLQVMSQTVDINVTDDGDAIPKEMAGTLFDAFARGDKARRSDGGSGLGLAIASAIVKKHRAELTYVRKEDSNCLRVRMERRKSEGNLNENSVEIRDVVR